jgi:hypothetical protein
MRRASASVRAMVVAPVSTMNSTGCPLTLAVA